MSTRTATPENEGSGPSGNAKRGDAVGGRLERGSMGRSRHDSLREEAKSEQSLRCREGPGPGRPEQRARTLRQTCSLREQKRLMGFCSSRPTAR